MLWFRIAETLGGRTVEEWQSVMSAREFAQWDAYWTLKAEEERRQVEQAKEAMVQSRKRAGRKVETPTLATSLRNAQGAIRAPEMPNGTAYDMEDPAHARAGLDVFAARYKLKVKRNG